MQKDSAGRLIEGGELKAFSRLPFNERLKWLREELNKIYVGEFTVKQVALRSNVISHMGLYNLEKNTEKMPRKTTINDLAKFYQVPVSIFSGSEPESFFLGKQFGDEKLEAEKADIRDPHYKLKHTLVLYSPEGKIVLEELIELDTRYIDAEEWLARLQNEKKLLQRRTQEQKRLDEAYDRLNGVPKND